MADLAIMCGIPKSGKSTYAKRMQEQGYVRICPDDFRLALHGEYHNPSAEGILWANVELAVRALLMSGHNVVVDATNTRKHARAQWKRIAKEFSIMPTVFYLTPDKSLSMSRNQIEFLGDMSVVSAHVIERMVNQFEEPTEEEGFYVVKVS